MVGFVRFHHDIQLNTSEPACPVIIFGENISHNGKNEISTVEVYQSEKNNIHRCDATLTQIS